ncbi:C6 zinc finger domain protein [Phyllosticta capitalensis]
MPRRKATNGNQPPKSRSRSGCLTCRKRKIRCDEGKPTCSNCRSKNLECQRGVALKWEAEYASRGLAFGRTGVWNKNGSSSDEPPSADPAALRWLPLPPIQLYHFVNSTIDGFEDSLAEQEELSMLSGHYGRLITMPDSPGSSCSSASGLETPGHFFSLPYVTSPRGSFSLPMDSILYAPKAFPQLEDRSLASLLNYYLDRLCPLTTPSVRSKSPFASLVVPFILSASPNALDSVLALAARHLAKSNRSWKSVAMQLEGKVLHTLRKRLISEDPSKVALDPEVPIIMMMLCMYEIINKCDERWVIHLKGARDLFVTRRKLLAGTSPDSLLHFSERFFAYQDVIGRTACGEVPIFGHDYWKSDDQEVDAWLGGSPELISIVFSITDLCRLQRVDPEAASKDKFAIEAEKLERRLASLVQTMRDPSDELLWRSAEMKRLATVVYLYCALYGASPTTPLVVDHVRQILKHVAYCVDRDITAALTWPVFVAAAELDPLQDEIWNDAETGQPVYGRPLVLKALDHMSKTSVANALKTRSVITAVWQEREIKPAKSSPPPPVTTGSSSSGESELNDWAIFVAPFSRNMSLA